MKGLKKVLLCFAFSCMIWGVFAGEVSSGVLYALAMQVIAEGEMSKDEMIVVLKACAKNNKKVWKQCWEVVEMIWDTEEKTETKKEYVLKEVIDGDTIKVEENGTTYNVRMIWLDAPESSTTRYGYIEEYGEEAKEHLKSLVEWKEITLEFDETQGEEDKYWRKLAYVFAWNVNINKQMIEDGYGWEYTYNLPYKYQSEFKEAQKTAELKNNGLRDPKVTWWKRVKDSQSEMEELLEAFENATQTYSSNTSSTYSSSSSSSSLCGWHTWFTGPRGGCYHYEWNSKVYWSHSCCY